MVLVTLPTREGTAPPRPEHFDERYSPPAHRQYPLALKNGHPRDSNLRFLEGPHVYLLYGTALSSSVTTVAHTWSQHFNAEEAVQLMRKSGNQRWPRQEYVLDLKKVSSETPACALRGLLMVSGGRTVASLRPHDSSSDDSDDIVNLLRASALEHDENDEVLYTFERELSSGEICDKWTANGRYCSNVGTEAHLQMQLYVEGEPYRADDAEVIIGKRFVDSIYDVWEAFATEKEIYAEPEDLGGSIDLLIRNRDTGTLCIIDYKVSQKLKGKMHGFKRMKAPMSHLDDCDGCAYALQLSIYRYILETYYGYQVEECCLMCIHPECSFCTSVPYLRNEAAWAMHERRATVAARRTCVDRCPLSGVALHDPVVIVSPESCTHEITVDRKTALAKGLHPLRDDPETQRRVDDHVTSTIVHSSLPPKLTTWKSLMPKCLIHPGFMRRDV